MNLHLQFDRHAGVKADKITPYAILDFPFWRRLVVFEIDGSTHDEAGQRNHDIGRDAYCRSQGFKVVRIRNQIALHQPSLCRSIVLAELG